MCFAIRSTKQLEALRQRHKDDPQMLEYIENEARWTLGKAYEPPVTIVVPDRIVPADIGRKKKVLA